MDDFYLSLFDGSKSGILSIGLDSIYLIWPEEKILDFVDKNYLAQKSCLKFNKSSNLLNVGFSSG